MKVLIAGAVFCGLLGTCILINVLSNMQDDWPIIFNDQYLLSMQYFWHAIAWDQYVLQPIFIAAVPIMLCFTPALLLILARKHKKPPKRLMVTSVIEVILLFYVSSYIFLSTLGVYRPAMFDMRGIMAYCWIPKGVGLDTTFEWQNSLNITYQPLLHLDNLYWHTDNAMWNGKYPVHKLSNVELKKEGLLWQFSNHELQ